jgi:oxygen-independent coproporphyrinogen III oxidase
MAGIYIHIPFCRKACNYCNFHFSTSTKLQKDFSGALLKEISLQKNYLSEPVSTIYFGGGTPSILPSEDIDNILKQLKDIFSVDAEAEVTLEANQMTLRQQN